MTTPTIPGQELEKAVSTVTTKAGTALVRSVSTVLNAWANRISAKAQADASEIKAESAFQGKMKRKAAELQFRREQEIAEAEHYLELTRRALGRFTENIIREQEKIESVFGTALHRLEHYHRTEDPRDIGDDWLRRFFRYASEVDEASILSVLSDALAEAALKSKPLISARALDRIRFFTPDSFERFKFLAKHVSIFGSLLAHHNFSESGFEAIDEPFADLVEDDLFKYTKRRHITIELADFRMTTAFEPGSKYDFDCIELTAIGREIAGLVDNRHRLRPEFHKVENYYSKLRDFHDAIGVAENFLDQYAKTLVSMSCDSDDMQINVWKIDGDLIDLQFEGVKSNSTLKYNIPRISAFAESFPSGRLVSECVLSHFWDFDERVAPVLADRRSFEA